eukprot:15485217-Alexandrium_andersonii.AAC.1
MPGISSMCICAICRHLEAKEASTAISLSAPPTYAGNASETAGLRVQACGGQGRARRGQPAHGGSQVRVARHKAGVRIRNRLRRDRAQPAKNAHGDSRVANVQIVYLSSCGVPEARRTLNWKHMDPKHSSSCGVSEARRTLN